MNQSPIVRALSILGKHKVKFLVMGGQACVVYGAAEFSRDLDLAILISPSNLARLQAALAALSAEQIYVPSLSERVLKSGHACHFRCRGHGLDRLRIDVMGVLRGLECFDHLWRRRTRKLVGEQFIAVMAVEDLVRAKKTQRDKDWPMVRRLLEADIFATRGRLPQSKARFWLVECRTPELLVSLAKRFPALTHKLAKNRLLLRSALLGNVSTVAGMLRQEQEREQELDKEFWKPLRSELERWRLVRKRPS